MTELEYTNAINELDWMLNMNHPMYTADVINRAYELKVKIEKAYQRQTDVAIALEASKRIDRLKMLEELYKDV